MRIKTEYLKFEQDEKCVSRIGWLQLAVAALIVAGLWAVVIGGGL